MNKRLIVTSVISIILISILFIGSTYSIFTTGEVDENQNVYTTGNLSVNMESNGVVISDNVPVSDDHSNAVTPTRITVTNNGTVSYKFNLILTDTTSSNPISSEYIKTKVGVLNPVRLSDTTDNIIKSDIVIGAGESVDIDVRVWLSDDIPSSELGKNFYAKLTIDGIGVYDDSTNVNNNDLSIAYMKTSSTSDFRSDTYINNIKNVSFVNYIDLSNASVDSTNEVIKWDMTDTTKSSEGTVIAWLENNEEDGFYDLYIGSEKLIFSKSLANLFDGMSFLEEISFNNLDTSLTTNMQGMFFNCSSLVELDLSSFNTSNVTVMNTVSGYSYGGIFDGCTSLEKLDISSFNTSKLTLFSNMFRNCSNLVKLDVSNFDTSNATDMGSMFFNCKKIEFLDVSNFDTSNVTSMKEMFLGTGYDSQLFTLDLGDKFDTSNVTNMRYMFYNTGYSSTVFTLDLGDNFDTSNVTDMVQMFYNTGYTSPVFMLDLGNNFDTSNVTNMFYMFHKIGSNSTVFTLDLGDKFDTSNVTNMQGMFYSVGYYSSVFTLDLGDKFDTSNVTNMSNMFCRIGYNSSNFDLNLGDKFDTSNVVNMEGMFSEVGYSNEKLSLDLSNFDFSNVTSYSAMFYGFKTTNKIYVKDVTAQNWILDKGFANLSTDNVIVKG